MRVGFPSTPARDTPSPQTRDHSDVRHPSRPRCAVLHSLSQSLSDPFFFFILPHLFFQPCLSHKQQLRRDDTSPRAPNASRKPPTPSLALIAGRRGLPSRQLLPRPNTRWRCFFFFFLAADSSLCSQYHSLAPNASRRSLYPRPDAASPPSFQARVGGRLHSNATTRRRPPSTQMRGLRFSSPAFSLAPNASSLPHSECVFAPTRRRLSSLAPNVPSLYPRRDTLFCGSCITCNV
jgi:hypothetical protein